MSDSESSEVDQFEQFRQHCQQEDISSIPPEMRAYDTQEEAESAMKVSHIRGKSLTGRDHIQGQLHTG